MWEKHSAEYGFYQLAVCPTLVTIKAQHGIKIPSNTNKKLMNKWI
jgi:hypothetical protein